MRRAIVRFHETTDEDFIFTKAGCFSRYATNKKMDKASMVLIVVR